MTKFLRTCLLLLSSCTLGYIFWASTVDHPLSILPDVGVKVEDDEEESSKNRIGQERGTSFSSLPFVDELTGGQKSTLVCQGEMERKAEDKLLDRADTTGNDYRIPLIIHQTSKSRCMVIALHQMTSRWRDLPHFSYYFHDDEAVDELLLRKYDEFPMLDQVSRYCVNSGATKADLWRLLILYLYGGIYVDIDSVPNSFSLDTLRKDDDAFFLVDRDGLPSQYFMAARPRHPVIRSTLQTAIHIMLELKDTISYNPVRVTGPAIYRRTFDEFCRQENPNNPSPLNISSRTVQEGSYVGVEGATLRLVGRQGDSDDVVVREQFPRRKHRFYYMMNMTHFTVNMKDRSGISCRSAIKARQRSRNGV